jgi:hypothetical protein
VMKTLDKFFEKKWSKSWNFLINHASNSLFKEIDSSLSRKEKEMYQIKFFNHGFIDEPFEIQAPIDELYNDLLEPILPVESESKTNRFMFWKS